MPDISMCDGVGCPIQNSCYRFTASPSRWQSYLSVSPYERERKACDFFMEDPYKNWDKDNEKKDKEQ